MTPEETLKATTAYLKNLQAMKTHYVAVGLPASKVGSKTYADGTSIIEIGAAHEFGAEIDHPGGTGYTATGGKAVFSRNDFMGPVTGITAAHKITIPERSFLRAPFTLKKSEINQAIERGVAAVGSGKMDADKALNLIGVVARNISVKAFETAGYGTWPDIKEATKKAKGSSGILIDKGELRGVITWEVRSE
ncbi:hypothetical protein ACROQ8_004682 [Yersinia enterocolitica]|uniref:hypothetical protein n=1 Tax=Yersinia TaxID=629 RepID=UPI0011A4D322|nr:MULTISPECIES: hypothetical protein [Yersinia]EKN5088552.1 hypothetical protein [Yersinia enterocolitica]UYJ86168.1 hypothetical protein N4W04_05505 [Yersinia enterocolitica]UYK15550.1 hypothetical protein N4224_05520 [Yersinia enterocolitica]HDL7985636.1 hypothetical protein [Yersinia enterocolitica]HDL8496993.1 hypothetical protein [Yersinia enterocolitica]